MELLSSKSSSSSATPSELLGQLGSLLGLLTVAHTMLYTLLPLPLRGLLTGLAWRLRDWLSARYHYVEIPELDESTCLPNELYSAIKLHISSCILQQHPSSSGPGSLANSRRVRLSNSNGNSSPGFTWSPCTGEVIPACFRGARVWWEHYTCQDMLQASAAPSSASSMMAMMMPHHPLFGRHIGGGAGIGMPNCAGAARSSSFLPDQERRMYVLKLHRNDKDRILTPYMDHILAQARESKHNTRERLLFTNNARSDSYRHAWDSVPFKHPSTFDTLALDPERKQHIKDDLLAFARGEEFYRKTGRAWKRGYLLYGPPGTGKSSLIAAMANLLRYDVYDLELTQVRSNGELRKLLLRTTSKSIIVIEDIDCSLELAGGRLSKASGIAGGARPGTRKGPDIYRGVQAGASEMVMMMNSMKEEALLQMQGISGSYSAVTLSGLLNFTDGLWSCCGDERIFVFTTNHIDSLDPALLRSGRMDMHIFMSYCTFPAFKILASNYLRIQEHSLFAAIESAMAKHDMTPAEVSEIFIRNKDKPPSVALEELLSELLSSDRCKPYSHSGQRAGHDEEEEDEGDEEDSTQDVHELVKQAIHPSTIEGGDETSSKRDGGPNDIDNLEDNVDDVEDEDGLRVINHKLEDSRSPSFELVSDGGKTSTRPCSKKERDVGVDCAHSKEIIGTLDGGQGCVLDDCEGEDKKEKKKKKIKTTKGKHEINNNRVHRNNHPL